MGVTEVYIIYKESSDFCQCGVCGAFSNYNTAKKALMDYVNEDLMFSDNYKKEIDLDKGVAKSDPNYDDEDFVTYRIEKYEIRR